MSKTDNAVQTGSSELARLRAHSQELEHKLDSLEQERSKFRDSLHEYRLLFRTAGTAIAIIEANDTVSLVNQKFEDMFGATRAEIEGRAKWTSFVAPRDRARMRGMRKRRLQGDPGVTSDYDATFLGAGNREIAGHITVAVIPDTHRCIASIADIGYRKHIEVQLAASERNYRTMFEESPVAIALLGTRGEVLNVNGRLHDWLGYSRDEVIGKNMLTLPCFPWRSKLRIMRKFTQRMVGRDLPPYDVTFTGKDGKYYYGRVQAAPIRNEKGRIISDLVMISNITDQVRAEQALQESEQKLIKAQEIAHLGYWEYDIENDHIIWSPELYRIYGVESDNRSLTHSVLQSLIHPEDQAYHDDVTNRMKDDGSAEFEYRVRRADGTVRYISGKGEASYDADGTPRRLFGVIQDITERRENEEARFRLEANLLQAQKLESLGVLAGGIAHDFNNLLMAIMGNAELARADIPRDSPAQKGLVEIDSISRDAADLCKQMLAYSGRGQFYVHPLNLTEVIESMAHLLNVSVEKNAIIKSELDPTVPSIEGDSSQIRQLVMNLITNASEAMGKKVGTITLRTGVRHVSRSYLKTIAMDKNLPEGDCVFVEVVDGGDGISSEVQQRMFDPFFSTKFTGRGLGLAAVLGIVRSHYGAIDVKSTPGKGTSVTVLFPKTDAPASPEGQAPLPRIKKDTPSPSRAQTILVVDDEQAVLSVTGQILSRAGYAVRAAASGADALAVVQKYGDTLGAVVLDLAMPQMSGLEALKQIRDVLPTIPVIVASGYSEEEAAEELAGNTITAFLPKPFSADALLKHIADALG